MTVALVDSTVGGEEIEIMFSYGALLRTAEKTESW
jgi:hypothetical protein